MESMNNVGQDYRPGLVLGQLLKVGLMEFVVRIWVYTKSLCLFKDFGLQCMYFFMISSEKRRPWSLQRPNAFAFGVNMP